MLISRLQAIHNPQDLGRIPTRAGGITQDQTNRLLRINDEDRADGECNALLIHVRRVLMIQHVVQISHFALFIADDREP